MYTNDINWLKVGSRWASSLGNEGDGRTEEEPNPQWHTGGRVPSMFSEWAQWSLPPQKATADKYSALDRLKGESPQGPSNHTQHLQTSAAASAPDETKDSSSSFPWERLDGAKQGFHSEKNKINM